MKTESKEEELTLKSSRLKMLLMASEELVEKQYMQCREYLLVFVDTIPTSSVGWKELHDADVELMKQFNVSINIMEKNIEGTLGGRDGNIEHDPLRGLPVGDYRTEEVNKAQRHWGRFFHAKCWSVANEYELIPAK